MQLPSRECRPYASKLHKVIKNNFLIINQRFYIMARRLIHTKYVTIKHPAIMKLYKKIQDMIYEQPEQPTKLSTAFCEAYDKLSSILHGGTKTFTRNE